MAIVSVILWSLVVIVSFKYAILIMRADNRGEGGIVALLALLDVRHAPAGSWRASLLIVGLVGAALLYGDGVITPAISVLSAVEGLKLDAPQLAPVVVPISIVILFGLFVVQRHGTTVIGNVFGPIMLVWFIAIGVLGLRGIIQGPGVLAAISPLHAVGYLTHVTPAIAFAVIGAAFLALTGAEAMYADMGHFGAYPIRLGWFAVCLPMLMLNYFGQGGLLLGDPKNAANPFYLLAPSWMHYPLVLFATLATIIASQSIISGAYSLTQQAMQLGFLPRMRVLHTASHERGQIYMPMVNWLLAVGTLGAERADRQQPVDHRHVDLSALVARGVQYPHARQEAELHRLLRQRIGARDDRLRGDDRRQRGEQHQRVVHPARREQVERVGGVLRVGQQQATLAEIVQH